MRDVTAYDDAFKWAYAQDVQRICPFSGRDDQRCDVVRRSFS